MVLLTLYQFLFHPNHFYIYFILERALTAERYQEFSSQTKSFPQKFEFFNVFLCAEKKTKPSVKRLTFNSHTVSWSIHFRKEFNLNSFKFLAYLGENVWTLMEEWEMIRRYRHVHNVLVRGWQHFHRKQRLVRDDCNSKYPQKIFESSRFISLI